MIPSTGMCRWSPSPDSDPAVSLLALRGGSGGFFRTPCTRLRGPQIAEFVALSDEGRHRPMDRREETKPIPDARKAVLVQGARSDIAGARRRGRGHVVIFRAGGKGEERAARCWGQVLRAGGWRLSEGEGVGRRRTRRGRNELSSATRWQVLVQGLWQGDSWWKGEV